MIRRKLEEWAIRLGLKRYEAFVQYGPRDEQGMGEGQWLGFFWTASGASRAISREPYMGARPEPQYGFVTRMPRRNDFRPKDIIDQRLIVP